MTLETQARTALACLDLTSLNEGDSEASTALLCAKAQTAFGNVAAVCVWPRFVAQARAALPQSVRVAAVANFPEGELNLKRALADIEAIAQAGGDEIDVVLPWKALIAGQVQEVAEFLAEVRHASRPLTLKVIIESGELMQPPGQGSAQSAPRGGEGNLGRPGVPVDDSLIRRATQLALHAGADFIKTSTGKTAVSATPAAAKAMLAEIKAAGMTSAGFKASGGIRSVAQAAEYLQLAADAGLDAKRVRFGASGLLDDILHVLGGGVSAAKGTGY